MKPFRILAALLFLATGLFAQDPISSAEYAQRRAALREKHAGSVVIVDAGTMIPGEAGLDANTGTLDFTYLTGIQPDGAVLVLFAEEEVLFLPEGADKPAGIATILPREKFQDFAKEVLAPERRVAGKRGGPSRKILTEAAEGAQFTPIDSTLARMRLVKSEAELALLRKAAAATCAAHRAAMKTSKAGLNEKDLQKVIEETFQKEGGTGLAFPSIVGSGKNGTILHYMRNTAEMPDRSLVVMDIGAEYHGYDADITRTIPVNGKFSEEQKKAYQCVLDAQKAAEAILKPGVSWKQLDGAARKVFEEREMTKWSYGHAADMSVRHGLGHYVGLAVHDSGPYSVPLEPGMVITIEPGWYDKEAGFGIRIEDTYIVTKEGFERISAAAPREVEEIEKEMASR